MSFRFKSPNLSDQFASAGGEAKFAIADGRVLVNNAVETRKRKKIFSGDIVEFNGRRIEIRLRQA